MPKNGHWWPIPISTFALTAALANPAWPEAPGSKLVPDANGRYALAPIDGGVLKLDTRTGAVTECRRTADALNCALA